MPIETCKHGNRPDHCQECFEDEIEAEIANNDPMEIPDFLKRTLGEKPLPPADQNEEDE